MRSSAPDGAVRWLLVHDPFDDHAPWLAAAWRNALAPAERDGLLVLPVQAMTACARYRLRIDGAGTRAVVRIERPGQLTRVIDSDHVEGVLWLADAAWVPDRLPAQELAYQAQERQALLLAWLNGLGARCLARPRPERLSGPRWSPASWRMQAAACGLPVAPPSEDLAVTPGLPRLIVAHDRVVDLKATAESTPRGAVNAASGAMPMTVIDAARHLAETTGCASLLLGGVEDARGDWRFTDAVPNPDLRLAGAEAPSLASALARRMGMEAAMGTGTGTGTGTATSAGMDAGIGAPALRSVLAA